ncbi:FEN1 [Symbiodinium sp. CCMP2592]|nr:FEN1 [Symbiodinium sp. CCMP2592]
MDTSPRGRSPFSVTTVGESPDGKKTTGSAGSATDEEWMHPSIPSPDTPVIFIPSPKGLVVDWSAMPLSPETPTKAIASAEKSMKNEAMVSKGLVADWSAMPASPETPTKAIDSAEISVKTAMASTSRGPAPEIEKITDELLKTPERKNRGLPGSPYEYTKKALHRAAVHDHAEQAARVPLAALEAGIPVKSEEQALAMNTVVSDLVRAHVREPWQCFWADVIHELEEKQKGSAKKLFATLPGPARSQYVEVSLAELYAVMQHSRSGDGRPWHFLDHVSKRQWLPTSVSDLMDVAPPSWRPAVLRFGWNDHKHPQNVKHCPFPDLEEELQEALQSICRALPDEPWVESMLSVHGQCLAAAVSETSKRAIESSESMKDAQQPIKVMKSEPGQAATVRVKLEPGAGLAIAKKLLAAYPYRDITASLLDLGQVLRGCLSVAGKHFGNSWPGQLCIGSCGDVQSWRGQESRNLAGVLYSENHWALLCIFNGRALVYDGLRNSTCYDHAVAFVKYWEELGHVVAAPLAFAACTAQPDQWSCGHRVVLHLDSVLQALQSTGCMPEAVQVSASQVQGFVSSLGPAAPASSHASSKPSKPSVPASSTKQSAEPSTPVRSGKRPAADSVEADQRMTPPRPDRPRSSALQASPAGTDASTPRQVVQKTSKKARKSAKVQAEKPLSKAKLREKGTDLARQAHIDHALFQREHYAHGVEETPGHWRNLLMATAAPDEILRPLTCHVCIRLRQRMLQMGTGQAEAAASGCAAVVPAEADAETNPPALGPEVHHRGRPKAGEHRWRLAAFIREKRSQVYTQTSQSWSKQAVYYCRACEVEKKFCSHTCKKKVDDHERSRRHRNGLRRLGIPCIRSWPWSPTMPPSRSPRSIGAKESPGNDKTLSLHPIVDSVVNYIQAGQPSLIVAQGEQDPMADALFVHCGETVFVKSKQCKGHCRRVDVACTTCLTLCRKKAFRVCLASRSYQVDLARYAHVLFHASDSDIRAVEELIRGRDYMLLELKGEDFDNIAAVPSKLDRIRLIRKRFMHIPSWRMSPAFRTFMEVRLPKTPEYCNQDSQAAAHGALVRALGDGVAAGRLHAADLQLGALVATGALRSDALVHGLVSSFLHTLEGSWKNSRRKRSGSHIDEAAIMDAVQTLGRGAELHAMLDRFRVNPDVVKRVNLANPAFPDSFMSLTRPGQLKDGFVRVHELLKASSERLHIILDETTWSASYQQARLLQEGQDRIIGGAWDPHGGEDWSCLTPEDHPLNLLPKDRLAKTALHFVAHRTDNVRYVFEVACMPTATVIGCSKTMLQLLGQVCEQYRAGSGGLAPAGVAFDGCTANARINSLFIGLLPKSEWEALPFFSGCHVEYLTKLRYWPYGQLRHGSELMCSFHGAWHLQKRFALQVLSGARKARFADVWVDLASQLQAKLPIRAFVVQDHQSDRDSISRMSPPFLTRTWSALGQHFHALIAALMMSGATASRGFSKLQHASNSFSAFYLLCLHVVYNNHKKRDKSQSIHQTTVRNAGALCANIITSTMTSLEPKLVQERPVEEHFSRVKAPYRGQPTLRDGLFGLARLNGRQAKQLEKETADSLSAAQTVQCREPLTEENRQTDLLAKIANKSLASAIQYFCMHCVDETPDELSFKFFHWWKNSSESYFRASVAVEADDDEHPPEAEVQEAGDDAVQLHHLQLLEAVQDRAVVMEELQRGPDEEAVDAAAPELEEVPDPEELVPRDEDGEEGSHQPMTLQDIVRKAMAKPAFSKYIVGEEGGQGSYPALQRARLVMGPAREFIRLVRLEEGVLSQALLENRRTNLNLFNLREAELAAARRAASVCAQRTSRAAAWQKATEKFVAGFLEKPGADAGLQAVQAFRHLSDENPQIVVYQRKGIDAAPGLGVVLTVFRGSLTKQGDKLVVRTSKPAATDLPVSSTRRVHLAVLSEGDRELCFHTSCISEVLLLDPVNTIYAEVRAKCQASQTRLHVQLDASTANDSKRMGKKVLPQVTGDELPETETAAQPASAAADVTVVFNDRSFMRAELEQACIKFMKGLLEMYTSAGQSWVVEGYVTLSKGKNLKQKWDVLLASVPSYFLSLFSKQKGYAFSKSVYAKLSELVPKEGGAATSKGLVIKFLVGVHSSTKPAVVMPVFSTRMTNAWQREDNWAVDLSFDFQDFITEADKKEYNISMEDLGIDELKRLKSAAETELQSREGTDESSEAVLGASGQSNASAKACGFQHYTGNRHTELCFCQLAGNPGCSDQRCACPQGCGSHVTWRSATTVTFKNRARAHGCHPSTVLLTVPKAYYATPADLKQCGDEAIDATSCFACGAEKVSEVL